MIFAKGATLPPKPRAAQNRAAGCFGEIPERRNTAQKLEPLERPTGSVRWQAKLRPTAKPHSLSTEPAPVLTTEPDRPSGGNWTRRISAISQALPVCHGFRQQLQVQ